MNTNINWQHWLSQSIEQEEKELVLNYGKLLGLKYEDGKMFISNFERGIILRKIIQDAFPNEILELGTGRGFGTICMADYVKSQNLGITINTIDCISENEKQKWPHKKNNVHVFSEYSVKDFWEENFPDLNKIIKRHNGQTSTIIKNLLNKSQKFDFIFMDAAHDLRSVYLDLAGSIALLKQNGCMLMDDYAPSESFGLATCIAINHAKKYFKSIQIINSENTVYESENKNKTNKSMVFLEGRNNIKINFKPSVTYISMLRVAGRFLDWMYSPSSFKF